MRAIAFAVLCSFVLSSFSFAQEIDWDPQNRKPIRQAIHSCSAFLSPAEPKVNDSVGIKISDNTVAGFEKGLDAALAEKGVEGVRNGLFFITGIPMGSEKKTQKEFEDVLGKRGLLDQGVRVVVMSVPANQLRPLAVSAYENVLQRMKYFFPSVARDYQTPLKQEVSSAIISDSVVELPNAVFLFQEFAKLDASLTLGTHTGILLAYTVYTKMMLNWLLRPGTSKVEEFLKNASLSLPFAINYSVFGNFSKILEFYQAHGFAETAAAFPAELANFGATQGLTIFLQVMFYRIVITNGIGGWQNMQEGAENSTLARTVSQYIRVPPLILDAMALAMAGANTNPLFSMGPFDLNTGHVALAGLTAVGAVIMYKPKLLDPTLRWYKGFTSLFKGVGAAIGKAYGSAGQNNIR